MYDVVIKNGKVVDGSGSPWFVADVGVLGGRIARIGHIESEQAGRTIEAKGLVVAPGFVDVHNHSDFVLPRADHMEILAPFMLQGVTTLVTGNCGFSPAPLTLENLPLLSAYSAFVQPEGFSFDWQSMGEYLEVLSRRGVGFNVATLVAHGAVRIAVMGFAPGEASPEQMKRMQKLVAQSLDEGAFGLSAGLLYLPGIFCSTEELIEVSRPLIPGRNVFACHVRGYCDIAVECSRELIEIGRANGIPLQHSHLGAVGEPHWAKGDQILELLDKAREEGVDIAFDVIPYTSGNGILSVVFPPWAQEGGIGRLKELLQDPTQRERIRYDVENAEATWPFSPDMWACNVAKATGWKNIYLLGTTNEDYVQYVSKSFEEIGRLQGKQPFDAAADLMIADAGNPFCMAVGITGDLENEEGMKRMLVHPLGSICADAILTGRGATHPAGYGTFPRVLGQYVREQKLMRLEEAVRKMTSLPLQRYNIQDRGLLREGMWADITVFDPDTIRDNATIFDPVQSPSGIEYVLVNGKVTVEHGKLDTIQLAGQVLRP